VMPIPGQREPLVLVVVLVLDHLADGKLFCADGRPVPNPSLIRLKGCGRGTGLW
jgi:hypothetical protein